MEVLEVVWRLYGGGDGGAEGCMEGEVSPSWWRGSHFLEDFIMGNWDFDLEGR